MNGGIGLRSQHFDELLHSNAWPHLEVVVEHFAFQRGSPHWAALDQLAAETPILLHGLHLNIGGCDPLDVDYLAEIVYLCQRLKPRVYSDHLAFSQDQGRPSFDLLPVPRTRGQQTHIVDRVQRVQDRLGQRIGLENISAYAGYAIDRIPELEFLQGIADQSGCGILLDLNNLYVNAHNFSFDPHQALSSLDEKSILQYHCSGHRQNEALLHDTHDQPVIDTVWQLYHEAVARFGEKPLILERDDPGVTLDEMSRDLLRGSVYAH